MITPPVFKQPILNFIRPLPKTYQPEVELMCDIFARIVELEQAGESHDDIARQLQSELGVRRAVLVCDSSGFTRRSRSHGIIHFLRLVASMRTIVAPILQRGGAEGIRFEADNVYAAFESPDAALATAVEMHRALNAYNKNVPEDEKFYLCMGIGYGDVLRAGHEGYYGNEMNTASKLGEDTADPREILISQTMYIAIRKEERLLFEHANTTCSGLEFSYYVRTIKD